jgi:hypothetical protein
MRVGGGRDPPTPRQLRVRYPGARYPVIIGALRQETAEAKAQCTISEELGRLGWNPADLGSPRKSDPAKRQIGARSRRETTLSIEQTAGRLHLGTARSASVRLHAAMRQSAPAQPAQGA